MPLERYVVKYAFFRKTPTECRKLKLCPRCLNFYKDLMRHALNCCYKEDDLPTTEKEIRDVEVKRELHGSLIVSRLEQIYKY
jgi:hypothetical protein